ncbi:MBL fold metallo-hydrolase [Rhodovastum atsumiense]|uniref:MBL fold metallo-hydrolase n=1 Tax=Rhodovastum atsumiense TaxID=504468 RepID=A0A5M6IXH3_9PROT|nr:MBL fold metallo-hydrolase [Rhodovastum atsumiense]KAA5613040.1 MBL fold metallo-hydrolase [Rhodovastum atsumiense]CAH2600105.1 MBL fold metallo-hydrolase [Rhodovastum atsumiense]
MTITQAHLGRRGLLACAGAAALALPTGAQAKMPLGQAQAPYFYRFKLGDAECTVVTDGQLPLGDPKTAFRNITDEQIDRSLRDNFLPASNAVLEQNVLVVNFGDRVVLFDTGMGSDTLFGTTTGRLPASLRQAGIDPAAVDAVVMSHAHIDHCGGLIADDGSRHFPNAQYYIGQPDFEYWTDETKVPSNYPARPRFIGQARKNLLPVRDSLHFYKDGQEILPGITALSAPGHTVSHSVFMINSGNGQLCYIGDLAHHPVLLLERPRTQFAYDTDPVQSAESRVRMMDMFAANRIPILAYHFAWPGIGHIAKRGDGYHYVPAPMNLDAVSQI